MHECTKFSERTGAATPAELGAYDHARSSVAEFRIVKIPTLPLRALAPLRETMHFILVRSPTRPICDHKQPPKWEYHLPIFPWKKRLSNLHQIIRQKFRASLFR